MADAGIDIRTGSGQLVIDANYRNIRFVKKIPFSELTYSGQSDSGYVTPWSDFTQGTVDRYCFTLSDKEQLFGLGPIQKISRNIMPTSVTISHITPILTEKTAWFYVLPGTDISDVYVYTFGFDYDPEGTYGLQVFDAGGTCMFDSSKKYLRVDYWGSDAAEVDPDHTQCAIAPAEEWDMDGRTVQWYYYFDGIYVTCKRVLGPGNNYAWGTQRDAPEFLLLANVTNY